LAFFLKRFLQKNHVSHFEKGQEKKVKKRNTFFSCPIRIQRTIKTKQNCIRNACKNDQSQNAKRKAGAG
jgi:hypothetical protein